MRAEASLKRFDRVAMNMAHADVGSRCTGVPPGNAFVNGVVPAAVSHSSLHERHVLVAVILVVKPSARQVGVHHTHLDHFRLLAAGFEPERVNRAREHMPAQAVSRWASPD